MRPVVWVMAKLLCRLLPCGPGPGDAAGLTGHGLAYDKAGMILALPFPAISPILVEIGPFAIRWYALAYIAGLMFGWLYGKKLLSDPRLWRTMPGDPVLWDDLLVWAAFGVIIGGRLGQVLI